MVRSANRVRSIHVYDWTHQPVSMCTIELINQFPSYHGQAQLNSSIGLYSMTKFEGGEQGRAKYSSTSFFFFMWGDVVHFLKKRDNGICIDLHYFGLSAKSSIFFINNSYQRWPGERPSPEKFSWWPIPGRVGQESSFQNSISQAFAGLASLQWGKANHRGKSSATQILT